MAFLSDLIGSKTGKSHKRFIALLFAVVVVIISFITLWVEIPENNVSTVNYILSIFGGVIIFQSGASVFEKRNGMNKKDNTDENNT